MVTCDPVLISQQDNPDLLLGTNNNGMIRRSWHGGPDFNSDNITVWKNIYAITHKSTGYGWPPVPDSIMDGCAIYLVFKVNHLLALFKNRIKTKAYETKKN